MKDKIIIVEGAQGAGKTTFTNKLREKMKATDLYRLSGIKDRTESGQAKIKLRYEKLLEYVENCEDINFVFDRWFFSNEVYAILGYQEYSFTETYNQLLKKLDNLKNNNQYDIFFVVLYLEDESIFAERLARDEKHGYQKFEVESSIKQQQEYLKLASNVEQTCKNIMVIKQKNDSENDFEEFLQKIGE